MLKQTAAAILALGAATVGVDMLLTPVAVDVRSTEDLKTIPTKQEAHMQQYGKYEQVLESDAEQYFGQPLKHPTHIDVYDGPDGKRYEIVENVERLRFKATSTSDKETIHQVTTKTMIEQL